MNQQTSIPPIDLPAIPFRSALERRTFDAPGDYPVGTEVLIREVTAQGEPTGRTVPARAHRKGKGRILATITGHNGTKAAHKSALTKTMLYRLI